MRLARALKQKQAHPVLLPAQPPLPAAMQQPPAAWGAPSPGVPHRPGVPVLPGRCLVWVGSCARARWAGFLVAAATFPCLGDARGPGSALVLLTARGGCGSSGEGDALLLIPLPLLPASSPRWCTRLWQHWGPSRDADPGCARGLMMSAQGLQRERAELVSHGGHEAPPQPHVRLPGTAAVREQDTRVQGTQIRCVWGVQVWQSRCLGRSW